MLKKMIVRYSKGQIEVEVVRSARKSMAVQVKADQTVVARIPLQLPDRELKRFLSDHLDWIIRKYEEAGKEGEKQTDSYAPPWDQLGSSERKRIRERIVEKVGYHARIMGLSVNRIFIKNQKTRWGSCSSKGNVNFNYRLYYMPEKLLDYVVIHELAHRRHMDHSPAFWAEVARYCPDYRERRRALKDYSTY